MKKQFCWCGHEADGHTRTEDGSATECAGHCSPYPDQRDCKCDRYMPVEAAMFKAISALTNHVTELKLFIVACVDEKEKQSAGIINPFPTH